MVFLENDVNDVILQKCNFVVGEEDITYLFILRRVSIFKMCYLKNVLSRTVHDAKVSFMCLSIQMNTI